VWRSNCNVVDNGFCVESGVHVCDAKNTEIKFS
jgi:hypothetical protein